MQKTLYSLTSGQKIIGYAGRLYPQSAVNNIGSLLLIEDTLDLQLLERTLHLCISRNDALRLRIVNSNENISLEEQFFLMNCVSQYVSDENPAPIPFVDFSGKSEADMEKTILDWNSKPIDIYNCPLYEFKMVKAHDGRYGVFVKVDHLATDAWMSMLIAVEIIEVYYALKRGEPLPPPHCSFIDYIASEEAYLNSDKYKEDEEFWLSLYEKKLPITDIGNGGVSLTGKSERKTEQLDLNVTAAIQDFCKKYQISPPSLFNTALAIHLYKLRGSEDVLFGNPVLLRSTLTEKRTCGVLVNNMNVRLQLDKNKPFHEVCACSHIDQLNMLRHMRYPQLNLMMNVFLKQNTQHIWDVGITYQSARIQTRENVKFTTKWYASGCFAMPLYITVTDMDNTGRYLMYYEYQTELFSREYVDEIHHSLLSILCKGIENPETLLKVL